MEKNTSIKLKLVNIFSIIILFLLFLMLFSSITIIRKKFNTVSNNLSTELTLLYTDINHTISKTTSDVKETKENELKSFLESSSKVCDHLIKLEIETLTRSIKIIAEKENIQNAVSFNLFRGGNIKKNNNEYTQKYNISTKPIKYISLLNSEKTFAWPGRETRIGLELFNFLGNIKARTDIKKEFRESDNSEYIKKILTTPILSELNRIVSTEKGLIIKVYSKIKSPLTAETTGGLIGIMPIDNTFADYIKQYTGCEVIIYKDKGEFYSTSFFYGNQRSVFKNKPGVFSEIENKPDKIIFEDIMIENSLHTKNNKKLDYSVYKFIYYPIISENQKIIGMFALGVPIDEFKNIIRKLEKEEDSTFKKFENSNKLILNNINKSGSTMLKEFIYIIIIIMTLGIVISIITFDIIISKVILYTIKKLSKNFKDLSEGKSNLKYIKVNSNDEIGNLASYFNKFIENLKNLIKKIITNSKFIFLASEEIREENNKFIEKATNQSLEIETSFDKIYEINKKIETNNIKLLNSNKIKDEINIKFEKIKSYSELLNSISIKMKDNLNKIKEEKIFENNVEINNLDKILEKFIHYSEKVIKEIGDVDKTSSHFEDIFSAIIFSVEEQSKEIFIILDTINELNKTNKTNMDIAYNLSLKTNNLSKKADEFNDIIETFVMKKYIDKEEYE